MIPASNVLMSVFLISVLYAMPQGNVELLSPDQHIPLVDNGQVTGLEITMQDGTNLKNLLLV